MSTNIPTHESRQPDAQIAPGTILFGVYEILGVLGGGGMGWVYRARHKQLSSLRAIKVIRPELTANANMEQLFVREARALMQIHSDAVVRCHDLLSEDRRVYLVMELVEGPSLEEILRDGPISTIEVRALAQRIGAGLAAAHALGVVHRDLSPGNIILPNGRAEEAKLIDFGVAAMAATPGQTMAGDFKGKLAYASPEQFGLYGGKVDARSDIYSFGLVLAEAASGAPIPMGQTFYEAVELRKVSPRIPPNVPPELQELIAPLLRPDPAERPQSAEEVVRAASGEAIARVKELKPEKAAKITAQPQAKHWLIPLLYSATAVGVGLGLGLMIWLYRTAGVAPPPRPAVIPVPRPATPVTPAKKAASLVPDSRTPAPDPRVTAPDPRVTAPVKAEGLSRDQVIETAERLARYAWVCREANRHAACIRTATYNSDWQSNQEVTGVPYNWGGADGPREFERKLRMGMGAGAHKRHGVSRCTAGIDCSAFVAWCWGRQTGVHEYSTLTLNALAATVGGNVYRDLKPGDALNKPGRHVVLFAGYRRDGGPIVYEASGAAGRVILNEHLPWSRLAGYTPIRPNSLIDP